MDEFIDINGISIQKDPFETPTFDSSVTVEETPEDVETEEGLGSFLKSDINPVAIECLLKTIEINDLGDKVKIFWSDGLKHIPYNIKSDLVVCNPPHHPELYDGCRELLHVDLNWELHKDYYRNLHKLLNKNGHSLLLENSSKGGPDGMYEGIGSKISDFDKMIEQNLKIKLVNTFESELESKYYFIDVITV